MSLTVCNYQKIITAREIAEVGTEIVCHHCGVSARFLIPIGQCLEYCAEEFASDIVTGERHLVPIALCPSCHRENHLNADREQTPCMIKARMSREGCF